MCLLNLCPSKYRSPPSSPPSSPGPSTSTSLPLKLPTEPELTRGRTKSRSPSLAPSDIPAPLSRSGSVSREFTRARSGSLSAVLADDATARAKVNRGGVATSHSMFARQVDMRKSAPVQQQESASASSSKVREKAQVKRAPGRNGKDGGPVPAAVVPSKRTFGEQRFSSHGHSCVSAHRRCSDVFSTSHDRPEQTTIHAVPHSRSCHASGQPHAVNVNGSGPAGLARFAPAG